MLIAHVDMDAFFAACEEKENPDLKGKPVIVGALPTSKRGIVSTCNYAARKFGIHSAMPISHAVKRCPDGIYLRPNFKLYKKESNAVMTILSSFATDMQQVSIDEAYLDITERAEEESVQNVAKHIQLAVKKATKLDCSLGIAESKYVAKIASDFKKPRGIIIVKNQKKFLEPLPVEKISGVGKKSKIRFNNAGIKTIGDIASCDPQKFQQIAGTWAQYLQVLARGEDRTGITHRGPRKSQGHETTFMEDIPKEQGIPVIKKLCKRILDETDFEFKTITLKVRFEGFETITRAKSMKSKNQIEKTALEIYDKIESKKKIRLIGVRISNISTEPQATLEKFT